MTHDEFVKVLKEKRYSYRIEGDKILVTHRGNVWLNSLETLPLGVQFENDGLVDLYSLKTLPPGVVFKNKGSVYLKSLETLSPGVVFENNRNVNLESLKSLPPGVVFKNKGDVKFSGLGWVKNNEKIRIEGIDTKKLLNSMINKGVLYN